MGRICVSEVMEAFRVSSFRERIREINMRASMRSSMNGQFSPMANDSVHSQFHPSPAKQAASRRLLTCLQVMISAWERTLSPEMFLR
mmetsp:Transcript_24989/g.82382  ORF Transcript_24989/g.82382 Transcript_24989/m.82382 type:complete len:87 (+) Transcript_24989:1617-1877(+)